MSVYGRKPGDRPGEPVSNEWYYSKGKGKGFPREGISALEITELEALTRLGIEVSDAGAQELEALVDTHWCHWRDVTTKTGPHRYYIKAEIVELCKVVTVNRERREIDRERALARKEIDNAMKKA